MCALSAAAMNMRGTSGRLNDLMSIMHVAGVICVSRLTQEHLPRKKDKQGAARSQSGNWCAAGAARRSCSLRRGRRGFGVTREPIIVDLLPLRVPGFDLVAVGYGETRWTGMLEAPVKLVAGGVSRLGRR